MTTFDQTNFIKTELGRIDFMSGGSLRFVESTAELRAPALVLILDRPGKQPLHITVLACHLDSLEQAIDAFRRRALARPQPAPWEHEPPPRRTRRP